jgi:hypothetical protein
MTLTLIVRAIPEEVQELSVYTAWMQLSQSVHQAENLIREIHLVNIDSDPRLFNPAHLRKRAHIHAMLETLSHTQILLALVTTSLITAGVDLVRIANSLTIDYDFNGIHRPLRQERH